MLSVKINRKGCDTKTYDTDTSLMCVVIRLCITLETSSGEYYRPSCTRDEVRKIYAWPQKYPQATEKRQGETYPSREQLPSIKEE